jgi:hypothetical protein
MCLIGGNIKTIQRFWNRCSDDCTGFTGLDRIGYEI